MSARRAALLGAFVFAFAICPPACAEAPSEVHGSGDAYAAPGIALAWGILRGADEASTQVVVRIVADVRRYPAIAAIARNPFSGEERVLRPATATTDRVDVRVPRAQYADFPRTELRFYASSAVKSEAPALMIFYLGVPDTAPEFATEANLDAYLTDRIARARASTGKTP
jgi:hypothetical protein